MMFIGTKDISTFVLIILHQCPAEKSHYYLSPVDGDKSLIRFTDM